MKAKNLILTVLVSLSTSAFAQSSAASERTNDQREIQNSIDEVARAYVARDSRPFERIYLENYINVRSRPTYNSRAQIIAMMKADALFMRSGKKRDFETLSIENENPQIRFFGSTAIVTVVKKNLWRYLETTCLTRTQQTEVWIKRAGNWRLAAGHGASVHCESSSLPPLHPAVRAIPSITIPPTNADSEAEEAVRLRIDQIAAASAGGIVDPSTSGDQYFAKDYVSTNSNGEVAADRLMLLDALKAASRRTIGQTREEKAIQIFGETAICTFRLRPARRVGVTLADSTQQHTLVLVKIAGNWQIVASHSSKIEMGG